MIYATVKIWCDWQLIMFEVEQRNVTILRKEITIKNLEKTLLHDLLIGMKSTINNSTRYKKQWKT